MRRRLGVRLYDREGRPVGGRLDMWMPRYAVRVFDRRSLGETISTVEAGRYCIVVADAASRFGFGFWVDTGLPENRIIAVWVSDEGMHARRGCSFVVHSSKEALNLI